MVVTPPQIPKHLPLMSPYHRPPTLEKERSSTLMSSYRWYIQAATVHCLVKKRLIASLFGDQGENEIINGTVLDELKALSESLNVIELDAESNQDVQYPFSPRYLLDTVAPLPSLPMSNAMPKTVQLSDELLQQAGPQLPPHAINCATTAAAAPALYRV